MIDLRGRSIRTLAWLGDAEFEREVRYRLARRGDFPTNRLDAMKAQVVRAEAQARLLETIAASLHDEESSVVARARNAAPSGSPRGRRDLRAYRSATGLEALVAHWCLGGETGRERLEDLLGPELERAIDEAVSRVAARPRRG